MAKKTFLVNSTSSLAEFIQLVQKNFHERHYTEYKWSFGKSTLGQKALFHIWLREFYAHYYKMPIDDVKEEHVESIKRSIKRSFYEETAYPFMVYRVKDPWHPDKNKIDFTSCASWEPGEMYMVLEWLQNTAGAFGLILEAKGEYAKKKRSENGL